MALQFLPESFREFWDKAMTVLCDTTKSDCSRIGAS